MAVKDYPRYTADVVSGGHFNHWEVEMTEDPDGEWVSIDDFNKNDERWAAIIIGLQNAVAEITNGKVVVGLEEKTDKLLVGTRDSLPWPPMKELGPKNMYKLNGQGE